MSVDVLRNGLVPLDGQLPQILQEFCDHNDRIQKAQKIEQFSDLGRYDSFWYNVRFCIKFAEKLKCILALISLHAQNTWVRNIISDNDRHTVTIVCF